MRSFGMVEGKLGEAEFFLEEIINTQWNLFRAGFFFSAFVSAARSVTFAMQASMKGIDGFERWYKEQQDRLRRNKLARFFHECRTDSQHIGFNYIVSGTFGEGQHLYWFGEPEIGRYRYIPEIDVVTACQQYMKIICELVDLCFVEFGLIIDPDQIYTPDGLKQLGLSIEDVEIELGLPRGYTDVQWPEKDNDERRIALLRRSIPGCTVKPLLKKYLLRELAYPCEQFSVEDAER